MRGELCFSFDGLGELEIFCTADKFVARPILISTPSAIFGRECGCFLVEQKSKAIEHSIKRCEVWITKHEGVCTAACCQFQFLFRQCEYHAFIFRASELGNGDDLLIMSSAVVNFPQFPV